MKITDMLISAIIKKGILFEAHNTNINFEIPLDNPDSTKKSIFVHAQVDNITIRFDKEES